MRILAGSMGAAVGVTAPGSAVASDPILPALPGRGMRPHPALLDLARGAPVGRLDHDAEQVLTSAAEHRMSGLLRTQLADGRAALSDTRLLRRVVGEDLARQQAHRRRWACAAALQAELEPEGLATAMLKGVTFEARWHDRLGERPSGDIDLWLDPRRVTRFADAVGIIDPSHHLHGVVQQLVDAGDHQATELQRDGIWIDLHADAFKLGTVMRTGHAVFDRRVLVDGPDGHQVWALCPEDALVHHLLHLNKDRFRRLLGYVDVARLISRSELDWALVREVARAEGLTDVLRACLQAVDDIIPLDMPKPAPSTGLRHRIWQVAWPPRIRLSGDQGVLRYRYRQDLLALLAHGRFVETLRVRWRQRLLPPAAVVDDVYPGLQGPYLWRLTAGRIRATLQRRQRRRRTHGDPHDAAGGDAAERTAVVRDDPSGLQRAHTGR